MPKKTLETCNSAKNKKGNGEACKKMQIRPGTNWTNMSSEKIYESPKKKQSRKNANQTRQT
jgi:hypothetical protein